MTKSQLKKKISEAIYDGNVGIHELMLFQIHADDQLKHTVESLFNSDKIDQAWHVIKDFLMSQGKLTKLSI